MIRYRRGILVSGLIYFHRISDAELDRTPLRNWRAFEKICGGFKNVVIATTMWGEVEPGLGERRAEKFQDSCKLRARGWSMQPFRRDHATAAGVLLPILEHTTPRQPLQLQREISDLHLSLKQTTVARDLLLAIEALIKSTEQETEETLRAMTSVGEERLKGLEAKFHESTALHGRLLARKEELKGTHASDIQRRILLTPLLGALVRSVYLLSLWSFAYFQRLSLYDF